MDLGLKWDFWAWGWGWLYGCWVGDEGEVVWGFEVDVGRGGKEGGGKARFVMCD